jgi:hypothetical protein
MAYVVVHPVVPFALLAVAACGPRLVALPDPVPPAERVAVELDPSADAALDEGRALEARRAVLAAYDAVAASDWEALWELLSHETRALLDSVGEGDGRAALAEGRLVQGGRTWTFTPMELLLASGVADIVDDTVGEPEIESARRKELDLVSAEGARRRVVVIREADQWRLHMPRIPTDRLTRDGAR